MAKLQSNKQPIEPIGLSELLEADLIHLNLKTEDRWDALTLLVDVLIDQKRLPADDRTSVLAALFGSEGRKPSDIKQGVAVPSFALDRVLTPLGIDTARTLMAVGRYPEGVDYGARDGLPVKIIFLFALPRSRYKKQMPGLKGLARLFESGMLPEQLMSAESEIEFIELIEDAESWEFIMDSSLSEMAPPSQAYS